MGKFSEMDIERQENMQRQREDCEGDGLDYLREDLAEDITEALEVYGLHPLSVLSALQSIAISFAWSITGGDSEAVRELLKQTVDQAVPQLEAADAKAEWKIQ